jgi:nucleotide-binding universal stress UspA family protein
MRESSNKLLAEARSEAEKAGVRAETQLLELDERSQRISDRIANEAAAWPADLIVLGTHGRRGMDRLVLGSVAEGVARTATAPVMLVRGT